MENTEEHSNRTRRNIVTEHRGTYIATEYRGTQLENTEEHRYRTQRNTDI